MTVLLLPEWLLQDPSQPEIALDQAVAVEAGRIAGVGPAAALAALYPGAERLDLGGTLLMPGFVNAHQHGRGISQIQLGHADNLLELWIAGRRRKGRLDPFAMTRLAAMRMLANGVTACVHANYSYGTGDYEAEARSQLAAYAEAGLRVTFCVGAQDRGLLAYPPHEACFLHRLPAEVAFAVQPVAPPYALDMPATLALMDRLLKDFGDHPTIRLAWGPAGPQWVSDDMLAAIAAHARENGLGIHTHLLESPAQAATCRALFPGGALAWLERHGALGPHVTLAHAVWIDADDIARLARTGTAVVRAPGCNLRMRNGIQPTHELLRAGVPVALGSDNVALQDDEDLLGELRLMDALARQPDWRADERPNLPDLLGALTTNGARAAFLPQGSGRLVAGAAADLVAIDLKRTREPWLDPGMPPLRAVLARARGDDVRLTMVNGNVRYRDGIYAGRDVRSITDAAASSARQASILNPTADRVRETEMLMGSLADHYRALANDVSETEPPLSREP